MRKKISLRLILWLLLLLLFFLTFRHFFNHLFWHFHDEMQPFWFYEWIKGFHLNRFPVRWGPDLVWGAGYPLFNFLYPLPYYLGGSLVLLGLNLVTSFKVYFFFIQLLGLVFFNLSLAIFIKKLNFSKFLLLLTANLIFLSFPYRAVDVYVRGAVGEITLYFSLPFWFYTFFSYFKTKKRNFLLLNGLAYGLIILSHNIGAYFSIPLLLIFFFSLSLKKASKKDMILVLKETFLPFFLGLSLSTFFWLPALGEKHLMIDSPIFKVKNHFPFIKQLIWSKWGYGASHWGPNDDLSFQLGPASWLALLVSLVGFGWSFLKTKKINKISFLFLVFIGLVFYLLNIRSLWLWQLIPLLNYFQFPWRLLLFLNFFIPFFFFFVFLPQKKKAVLLVIYLLTIVLALFQIVVFFKPEKLVAINNSYFFDRYLSQGALYPQNSEEYLRLPRGSQRPNKQPSLIKVSYPETKVELESTAFQDLRLRLVNSRQEQVTIRRLFFPSWKITDNGHLLRYRSNKKGLITLQLPPGVHSIQVQLRQTPLERASDLISLGALLSFLILLFKPKKEEKFKEYL